MSAYATTTITTTSATTAATCVTIESSSWHSSGFSYCLCMWYPLCSSEQWWPTPPQTWTANTPTHIYIYIYIYMCVCVCMFVIEGWQLLFKHNTVVHLVIAIPYKCLSWCLLMLWSMTDHTGLMTSTACYHFIFWYKDINKRNFLILYYFTRPFQMSLASKIFFIYIYIYIYIYSVLSVSRCI